MEATVELNDTQEVPDAPPPTPDSTTTDFEGATTTPDATNPQPDMKENDACVHGMIQLEVPCAYKAKCSSETEFTTLKTIGCGEAGFDPKCCTGMTCKLFDASGKCSVGQLCAVGEAGSSSKPCVDPTCKSDAECKGGWFCLKPRGTCKELTSLGVCTGLPIDAPASGTYAGKLCGCDGKTYTHFAAAIAAKVSIAYAGTCCDPAKMPFDATNTMGFKQLEVCGLKYGAECVPSKLQSFCPSGETSCFIEIPKPVTGTALAEADWLTRCSAATGAKHAFGRDSPGCAPTLSPTPSCAVGCKDPCGCAPCVPGGYACEGATAFKQCLDNCTNSWSCNGLTCMSVAAKALCVGDCGAITASVTALLPTWQACTVKSDCVARLGHCVLGGCFLPVNAGYSQEHLDVFLAPWAEKSCAKCDCGGKTPGSLQCVGGLCSF